MKPQRTIKKTALTVTTFAALAIQGISSAGAEPPPHPSTQPIEGKNIRGEQPPPPGDTRSNR